MIGSRRHTNHGLQAGRIFRDVCLLTLALLGFQASDARAIEDQAIQQLRIASELHPDDADLAWALARKLSSTGQPSEALSSARRFLARWPERRPDARIEISRRLIENGAYAEAMILLDEAVELRPRSGTARFYRAIAYRASGQVEAANREFAAAGALAPELRSETLLARALGLFEMGQEEGAVSLLKQLLRQDPSTESAIRARLLLRQREALTLERSWRIDGYAGMEWDSNVTLESAANETPNTNQKDILGVWGLAGTWRAVQTEDVSLALGYRFDQTMHDDLGNFDLLTNTGIVSASWNTTDDLILRLDAVAWNTLRDNENDLTGGVVRPNLIYSLGPRYGALRAFAQYEILEYDDEAFFEQLERDGFAVGGGIEHLFPLPIARSWLTTSLSYQTTLTQAEPGGGSDGFDGDYDYDSLRIRMRANLGLPWKVDSQIDVMYSNDRYHNDNLFELITSLRTRKRDDDIVSTRLQLRREITPHAEAELYWRGTWRMSNLDVFDYDQHRVGFLIRLSTDS